MKIDFKNKWNDFKESVKNQTAMKGGSYSLMVTTIVLAILIVVNVFVSTLPPHLTKLDISSSKLYSITSNTKAVVNNLEEDVTIYWIVQANAEDEVIENLLGKYESLSDHIEVVKKNPDVYPTFAESYTSEVVLNNSLVVESGERYRYISYDDIYLAEADMSTNSYTASFDGEGAITSAIDYVVTEDLPKLYTLKGHGETEFPAGLKDSIEKENIEVADLSLLNIDEIPTDADAIAIYNPQSDLSLEEADILLDYVQNGGKLLVMAGPVEDTELENLETILNAYDVEAVDGIALDLSRDHYAFGYPYMLMPTLNSSAITDALIEENYYPIMPISQGFEINATSGVTSLMETSSESFSKLPPLMNYDKEENDTEGPFALGVSIDTSNDGQIIWYGNAAFVDDMYNAFSSGANIDLVMNSLSSLIGEREAIAIRSKQLNYNYLTISDSDSDKLNNLMTKIIPIAYLGVGIYVVMRRRSKQNETN